eukprot:SAG22_NODE_611_length_8586_cov_8.288795_7_plen_199_part_00
MLLLLLCTSVGSFGQDDELRLEMQLDVLKEWIARRLAQTAIDDTNRKAQKPAAAAAAAGSASDEEDGDDGTTEQDEAAAAAADCKRGKREEKLLKKVWTSLRLVMNMTAPLADDADADDDAAAAAGLGAPPPLVAAAFFRALLQLLRTSGRLAQGGGTVLCQQVVQVGQATLVTLRFGWCLCLVSPLASRPRFSLPKP